MESLIRVLVFGALHLYAGLFENEKYLCYCQQEGEYKQNFRNNKWL